MQPRSLSRTSWLSCLLEVYHSTKDTGFTELENSTSTGHKAKVEEVCQDCVDVMDPITSDPGAQAAQRRWCCTLQDWSGKCFLVY